MALDNFETDTANDAKAHDAGALSLLGQSFAYEASREWVAVKQVVGADVKPPEAPAAAETVIGRHMQMLGAATADLLPALGVALLTRYTLGRSEKLSCFDDRSQSQFSPIGWSFNQALSTGFLTGFLLQPTEGEDANSMGSLLLDRAKKGLAGGITYAAINASAHGAEAVGKLLPDEVAKSIATHPFVTGVVSGAIGGVVGAETDSLATTWSLTTDLNKINQSVYQMALFGGVFGAATKGISTVHQEYFSDYATVRSVIDPGNDKALNTLRRLRDGLDFDQVPKLLDYESADARAFYNRFFQRDVELSQVFNLEPYRKLYDLVKPDDATFDKIIGMSSLTNPTDMTRYIEEAPQTRVPLFVEMIGENFAAQKMNRYSFGGLEFLNDKFGKDSPVTTKIKEIDKQYTGRVTTEGGLGAIGGLLQKFSPETLAPLVEQVAQTGNEKLVQGQTLRALASLRDAFGPESFASSRLVDLANKGLDLRSIANHLPGEGYGSSSVMSVVHLAKKLMEQGEPASKLDGSRLLGIHNLTRIYGENSEDLKNVLRTEGPKSPITALAKFAADSEQNKELLAASASKASRPKDLRLEKLKDSANFKQLQQWFPADSKSMSLLMELQKDSLSAARLTHFVGEAPESRVAIVEQLIDRGADSDRFNEQMNLGGLPDDVALRVADQLRVNGIKATQVIGPLKDWQSGRYFRQLISDFARDGQPINEKDIAHLAEQAKVLAREKAPLSERKPDADSVRRRFANSLNRSDGVSELYGTDEGRFDLLTQILHGVADKIAADAPKNSSVVLLGRDSWPLLPVLADRGVNAQYFLWSRLQSEDATTKAQWLKEVPPNAHVIDTGYRGSIINLAREVDDTARGSLFSSADEKRYGQLLPAQVASRSVSLLEGFPKMIGRSERYTESGSAVARFSNRDGDERFRGVQTGYRWMVEAENRRLLKALGLPEWDTWRYGTFTGLSPSERLRVNTAEDLASHYRRVAEQRELLSQRYDAPFVYGDWF